MSKTFYHKTLDSRTVFDAIFWVLDSGAKWRYLPKNFQLIGIDLTGGEIHDSKVCLKGKTVLADKAFCSDEIRKKTPLPVFPTNPMPSNFTALTKSFTKQETLSKDFFSVSKISDTLPRVMINYPIAF